MARITYTLGELMGSVGGLTFQRNSAGAIVRQRPIPSKQTTTRQSISHAAHIKWLFEWQKLTQSQRDAWNVYADTFTKINKFGQVKFITGQNWFETSNYYMEVIGEAIMTSPPIHTLPENPQTFNLVLSASQIQLNFTEAHDCTGNPILIWVSAPTKRNTPTVNQIRRLAQITEDCPIGLFDITAVWENAIGLPWTPATLFPNANIFVCLQSLRRSSGITSALLCAKQNTAATAIDNIQTDTGDDLQTDAGVYLQTD